jgi:hypothetical protein
MQMRLATVMVMQREFGNLVQMKPPARREMNCTAPPGICRYWVPSVSTPKDLMMMLLKLVNAELGTCAPVAMTKRIQVLGSRRVCHAWYFLKWLFLTP